MLKEQKAVEPLIRLLEDGEELRYTRLPYNLPDSVINLKDYFEWRGSQFGEREQNTVGEAARLALVAIGTPEAVAAVEAWERGSRPSAA
jgi:hypothetical protein